jgi:hypothetical protein
MNEKEQKMNDEKKLVKMQEDDLIIVELDSRFDMSIIDPVGLTNAQPVILQQSGCSNNCVQGC